MTKMFKLNMLMFTFINLADTFIQTKYIFGELHLQMSYKCEWIKKATVSVYVKADNFCIMYNILLLLISIIKKT